MLPGARSKVGAPVFEPEVFRKQIRCIEENTCDILLELFDAPDCTTVFIRLKAARNGVKINVSRTRK